METKASFTLLILSALVLLLDGFSGVFLCSDLISGGSVVTFDNGDGNDGHGDGSDMVISISLRCLSPHSVCFDEGGMGVFYGGDGGLEHQPSSNTSFDLIFFAHGGGDGVDGGGETVEIDEILTKEEAPSLAMTATFVSVGDDVSKTAARATSPCLNGLGLDQLGFNIISGLAMTALPIGADDGGRGMVAARASVLALLVIGLVWAWLGSARVSLEWALVDAIGLESLI